MIGLKHGNFLNQYKFTVQDWDTNPDKTIAKIIEIFKEDRLVIRSSCLKDTMVLYQVSMILNSRDCNFNSIKDSVEKVIQSYGVNHTSNNQVLVQKYLSNVDFSGVAFSRMIDIVLTSQLTFKNITTQVTSVIHVIILYQSK